MARSKLYDEFRSLASQVAGFRQYVHGMLVFCRCRCAIRNILSCTSRIEVYSHAAGHSSTGYVTVGILFLPTSSFRPAPVAQPIMTALAHFLRFPGAVHQRVFCVRGASSQVITTFKDPHDIQSITTQSSYSTRSLALVSSPSSLSSRRGSFISLLATSMGLWSIALAASRTQAFNVALLFVPTLVLVQRQPQRWTGPCNPALCRVRGGQCHISSRVIPTIAGTNTNHFRNVGLATTARCHRQGDKLV